MSNNLGLFYAQRLRNHDPCTFILTFLLLFLKNSSHSLIWYQVFLSKTIYTQLYLYYHQGIQIALDGIQCPQKADEVFAGCSTLACPWVEVHRRSLTNSPLLHQQCPTCIVCLIWMIYEIGVSGHTDAILKGADSRICSEQHVAFLFNFHLAFSPGTSLKFKWCNHTIVLTWQLLGGILILSYQRDQISMWSIACQ